MTGDILRYVLAAAHRGWPVFPLAPGSKKPPLVRNWEQEASIDPQRIRDWWSQWPNANFGIATGPARLLVVDLDIPKNGEGPPSAWQYAGITDGADALAYLAEEAGAPLPLDTFTVRTQRGGLHLYFAHPPGPPFSNTSHKLGWLIDTRAHGGYVVGPGSRVTTQRGSGRYEVENRAAPAILPAWILQRLRRTVSPGASHWGGEAILADVAADPRRRGAYATSALRSEVDKILRAPEGQRNHTLYIAAASLGQLTARNLLDSTVVATALQQAAEAANSRGEPNGSTEIANTIQSGLRKGASAPRRTRTETPLP